MICKCTKARQDILEILQFYPQFPQIVLIETKAERTMHLTSEGDLLVQLWPSGSSGELRAHQDGVLHEVLHGLCFPGLSLHIGTNGLGGGPSNHIFEIMAK